MFRKSSLAMVLAVAISVTGATGSAEAHFGRGGGGGRIGGGSLIQRARQGGNANGYRDSGNSGVARRPAPAPQTAPPAIVQSKPPVTTSSTPATAKVVGNGSVTQTPAPANTPATAESPAATTPASASVPVATDAPAAAPSAPPEVVSKEPRLPQIPVGATVTLNGKDLSDKVGQVVLQVGDIAVPVAIKEWKNDVVVCTLPILGLTKPSPATLHVLKADGTSASAMNLELVTTLPTLADNNPSLTDSARFGR